MDDMLVVVTELIISQKSVNSFEHVDHVEYLQISRGVYNQGFSEVFETAKQDHNISFFMRKIDEVDYRREVRFGDVLMITTEVIEIGKTSVTFKQRMKKVDTGDEVFTVKFKLVAVDEKTRTSVLIPDDIRSMLEGGISPQAVSPS